MSQNQGEVTRICNYSHDFALGPVQVGLCVPLPSLRLCDNIPSSQSLEFSWDLVFGVWDLGSRSFLALIYIGYDYDAQNDTSCRALESKLRRTRETNPPAILRRT
jgi:hypothetical protein